MRTRLSASEQRKAKMRRLAICNRIQLQEPDVLAIPDLDVNQDGQIDTLEVGKYVIRLLRALDVEVPDGLSSDDPNAVAEALLTLLEDVGPQPLDDSKQDKGSRAASAISDSMDPIQMRARRRGQRTQLSTGGKLSYGELLRKPHAQMTYGDRHRLALFKIGVNPDSKDGKYSAGKQS